MYFIAYPERISGEECSTGSKHTYEPRGNEVVKKDIESLEIKFNLLISDIKQQLISEKKKTDDLHEKLLYLPQPLQTVFSPCLEDNYRRLDRCDSLDHKKFFSVLHNCWNFIDSDLLEYIIQQYGNEKVTRAMDNYLRELEEFRKRTTVHQLVVNMGSTYKASEIPQNYIQCVAKLDRDAETCTLQELESLRKEVKNFIGYLPLRTTCAAMYLHDVKTSSVIVVWLVPIETVDIQAVLSQSIHQHMDIIDCHRIEFLSLDDYIIYPVEEVCDTHA